MNDLCGKSPEEARQHLADQARLAARGRYKCASCGKEGYLKHALLVVARRNILVGLCMNPSCIGNGVIIKNTGDGLIVAQPGDERPAPIRPDDLITTADPGGEDAAKPVTRKLVFEDEPTETLHEEERVLP